MLGAALLAAGAALLQGLDLASPAPRVIDVVASRYRFEPAQIEVSQGEEVTLRLRSADTEHGIGIPALQVKSRIPKGAVPTIVQFRASRAGSFKIECSEYCGAGHRSMRGMLVVRAIEGGQP